MSTSTVSPLLKIGLGLIGMWPGASHATLCWFFYMTTLVAMQYFQYSYVYAHLDFSNLTKLMDGLGLTLDYTLTILKLLSFWFNRRIFVDILVGMDNDWKDCGTDLRECVMMDKANLAHRCSNAMISVNALATFVLSIGVYAARMMSNSGGPRAFPVKMELPLMALESPLFECILAGQMFYILSLASVVGMINALLATLIIHVGGQVDIMRQAVTEVHSNNDELGSSLSIINNLIHRHQKIITLSDDIESLFSSIALMQLLWNTLIICFTGFMIIIALSTNKGAMVLIKSMFLYIAKTLEVFVFCYAGEFLSFKSKSISDAIYESLWYNMVPSDSRIMLFIMMRSQKRLTITAGKIFDLTLEGFMSVMKASASYMSVLHATI
ncbi:odorant receptor 22c-like isoform X2 [Temnothorax americanus]|uniref:odorant receptor 22c-like isoform X2 n=1 Tax=Temnothorax americanus TaxID=1964332 RepID=UPI0040686268